MITVTVKAANVQVTSVPKHTMDAAILDAKNVARNVGGWPKLITAAATDHEGKPFLISVANSGNPVDALEQLSDDYYAWLSAGFGKSWPAA